MGRRARRDALPGRLRRQRGNHFPGAILWVARCGWETINAVTGAYAVLTVLHLLFGIGSNNALVVVTLLAFVAVTFLVSGLGRKALNVCNKYSTYLFGLFSMMVLVYLVATMDWAAVFAKQAGTTAMVIAGIGTIAAGGISWVPTGPDFTRYLPHSASAREDRRRHDLRRGPGAAPMVLMGGGDGRLRPRSWPVRTPTRCPSSAACCRSGSRCRT